METVDNIERKLGIIKDSRLFDDETLKKVTLEDDFEAAFERIAKERLNSEIIIVTESVGEEKAHKVEEMAKEKGLRVIVVDTKEDADAYRRRFEQEVALRTPDYSFEEIKKQEYDLPEPYELEHRREMKEQMKQRSRYLSKHCRK